MTIKNKKITLCLFISIALAACSEQESAETYLAQAKSYAKESQHQASIVSLKNAVRLAPENGEMRFFLGQAYLNLGSALDAVKELEKAQALNYQSNKLIPSLARAYLIANDYESILALKGPERLPDESKVEFLAYKTLAAIRTQQFELAKETSQLAMSLLPANVFSTLSKAYIALSENNLEKAEALVAKINNIDDKKPEVIMLGAQIATAQQDHGKASELYQRYETLQPNSRIVYLLIADSLVKANRYEEAEKYADVVLSSLPNQPIANYVKATARFFAKDFSLAIELAEKAIQNNLNTPQLRLIAGASAYNLANFEKAYNHLSVIAEMLVPEHPAKKMLIVSQFQLGLIDDLTDSLDDFSPQNKADEQFLSALSFNLYTVGATQEAKKLAAKSTNTVEGTPAANAREGMLKLLMNDPSGVENLELALEKNPALKGAELAIAYAALQSGELEKAYGVAQKWQEKHPDDAGSYNMLGAVYLAQQKTDLAIETFQTSLTKKTDNLYALTELAKLNFKQGNIKLAEQFAQRAVEKHPDNPKALRYYYAIKSDQQSLEKIKQAYQQNNNNIELKMLYIDALINSDDLMSALAVSNTIDTSVKTPKKAWVQRIAIHRKQSNELQLITTIEKWLQANPYHIEAVLLASAYYVKQRQIDKALQYLDKALLGYHQKNLMLNLVKLQLLLDKGRLYEAKKLYQEPQFQAVKPELKSGLEGRIALLEKDYSTAVEKLTPFYQAFPSSQNVILLSLAYQGSQQQVKAQQVLQAHLLENEQDDRVRMILANMYLATEPKKAILAYEKTLINEPNNVIVLNNLSWLYLEQSQLEKAQLHSKKAIVLAPENPNVIDTRGMVLLKSGNKLEAWKALSKAYELSKGRDMNIVFNYAEVLIANKLNKEAIALLQQSTTNNNELSQRKESLMKLAGKS